MMCRAAAVTKCVLVLLLAACNQQVGYSRGGLSGAYSIALTGDSLHGFVFITSADTNDLKVLRLEVLNSTQRSFVSAPNPLESLSIPTINRPTALTVDDFYDATGRLVHGEYVYVSRPGGAELSVVGALPSEFREVARLATPGPVITTAAVRLDPTTSRLYFASYDGARSTLYSIDLPADPNALRALTPAQLSALTRFVVSFGADSVAALLIVPVVPTRTTDGNAFCDTGNHCLVVATRRNSGAAGDALMLDPVSLRTARLAFPGPVRLLTTFGRTLFTNGETEQTDLLAGQRIFAILDEEKCGGPGCGGVVSVDATTAVSSTGGFPISKDFSGQAMLPLVFGESVVVGLSISASVALLPTTDGGLGTRATRLRTFNDNGTTSLTAYPALGVVTAANGQITFFDANTMQQIDGNSDVAKALNPVFYDNSGFALDYITGVDAGTDAAFHAVNIKVGDGIWRSQTIYTTWEGVLSDTLTPTEGPKTTVTLPTDVLARLTLGDVLIFQTATTACADAPIIAIGETTVSIAAVPPNCTEASAYYVRAGPSAPFTVRRSQLPTYLGRAKAGDEFVWDAGVYVRLSGYSPTAPALAMGLGLDTNTKPPPRDSTWQFFINGGYSPYTFLIDPNAVGCVTQLPGQAIFDELRGRVFVLFPSGNSLVDIDPALAQRVTLGPLQNTFCYY